MIQKRNLAKILKDDLLNYFIGKFLPYKNYDMIEFLDLVIFVKFRTNKYDFKSFPDILNWLIRYSSQITSLCNIFEKIAKFCENPLKNLHLILENETIIYDDQGDKITHKLVNEPFFLFLDIMLEYFLEKIPELDQFEEQIFYDYLSEFRSIEIIAQNFDY